MALQRVREKRSEAQSGVVPSSPLVRVLRDDGTLDPALDPGLGPDEVISLYRYLLATRIYDERLIALQRQGRIGFHIGSLGEEAAILGSTFAMREQDWVFPCYREWGAAIMRGMPLQRFIDNMFGNANDLCHGRQMPQHLTARSAHWGSVSSPVGTQISQAVGFSWAAKMRGDDVVTLVYFGEGATSSNDFHSGMNFAGVFKTPTVFFCRNNGWAISVPSERQTASETFAEKAAGYGIKGVRVDGNDLFAVVAVTRAAMAAAAKGEGPTLIEALTYRMGGHSTSDDPKLYRGKEQLDAWAERDPIERVRHYLESIDAWDAERDKEARHAAEADFKAAVKVAEETPPPPLGSMFEDVFEKPSWNLVEQSEALLNGPRAVPHH